MINWKPLGGRSSGGSESPHRLPGQRGVRMIYVPDLVPNRYIHFSWRGDSFCIRDYLGDREMRQSPGMNALDIWKMHKGPVFSHHHSSEDTDFWKKRLREITDETSVGKKE